ncbi:MAG TPA: ABC transporter ATP-binding protein [Acidimicrobiales bacterium]|nr:ABC transporter ATP-binding protein [Acidimicrobiales bacterium]
MADLRRSARLLWSTVRRTNLRLAAAAVGLDLLVQVAGRPLTAVWLKLLVDGATAGHDTTVVWAGLALALSLAAQGTAGAGVSAMFSELHETTARVLVGDIMRLTSTTPGIEHHERPEYADRVSLLRNQTRLLSNVVATIGSGVGLVVRLGITVVLLASVHPAMLLLPLLAVPSVWAGARASRITEAARDATAERVRSQTHLFNVVTTPGPAKEARVFNLSAHLVDRHRHIWAEVTDTNARAQLRAGMVRALGWSTFAAGYVAAIVLAVSQAAKGRATPGDVLLVVALASDVSGQVSRAVSLASETSGTMQAIGRLLWLNDYDAAARRFHDQPASVPDRLVDGIAFHDVGFRYPGTDVDVLAGVNLQFPAGCVVAVVGENGAGKTTLVKLLSRYYEPSRGRITVDGIDLHRFDVDAWRRRMSAGFQDFVRFQETLAMSVGLGHLHHAEDRAAIAAALAAGQAADLTTTLPGGFDALLGKEFEGGTDLSEGQWQKVAISRALMDETPLVLILDEPTSGLDADAEHALFEHYASAASRAGRDTGAVTVLISHRFSTVRLADLIVVVDGGRVREHGSHEELIAAGGLYAELYGIQAQAYH